MLRMMSSLFPNISKKGDTTVSLDKLCHCYTVKRFLIFMENVLGFGLCPLSRVLSLDVTEKSLSFFSPFPFIMYLYTLIRSPLLSLLFSRSSPGCGEQPFLCCSPPVHEARHLFVEGYQVGWHNIQSLRMERH